MLGVDVSNEQSRKRLRIAEGESTWSYHARRGHLRFDSSLTQRLRFPQQT